MAKTKANEQIPEPALALGVSTILPLEVHTPETAVLSHGAQEETGSPETGKPGLPVEVLENEGTDAYEDEAAEQEDIEIVAFTEKDEQDFPLLEQKVGTGKRHAFDGLREIRQRQLWRLIRNDHGEQRYATFDEYVEERWGHSRQWVTHGTNWLTITEEMERLGVTDPPHLSVKAAQGLLAGRLHDAGGLRAILHEAKEDGVPLDRDHLREIVLRRADYNYYSKDGTEYVNKPAAKTYAEYKKDLAVVKPLGHSGSYSLWDEVLKAAGASPSVGTALGDALVTVVQQKRMMPSRDRLLANFTGVALEELVGRLLEVANEIKVVEAKKTLLAQRRKELKALTQDGGVKKLKDETKALEEELAAVGAIKRRGKKGEPPPEDDGRGIPFPEQDEGDDEHEDDVSQLHTHLADALNSLDLALECEWPDGPDEIQSIVLAIQDCGESLAEIKAKVEKCLAEVEEPEAIPSGEK